MQEFKEAVQVLSQGLEGVLGINGALQTGLLPAENERFAAPTASVLHSRLWLFSAVQAAALGCDDAGLVGVSCLICGQGIQACTLSA